MGRLAETKRPVKPIREWSRSTLMLVIIGTILVIGVWRGCLGATSSLNIQERDAIRIAQEEIHFTPEMVDTKFGRKGFPGKPIWHVYFAIPSPTETGVFEHRVMIEVDANSGDILSINQNPEGDS